MSSAAPEDAQDNEMKQLLAMMKTIEGRLQNIEEMDRSNLAKLRRPSIWWGLFLCVLLIVTILIIVVALLNIYHITELRADKLICNLAVPAVLFSLSLGFLASLSWALLIYAQMRNILWPDTISSPNESTANFSQVASRHGKLSQLWFSIAITVLLGAVIFAIFQVSYTTCKGVYYLQQSYTHGENNYDNALLIWRMGFSFLSKLFIYSLFFACWLWAIKNYRAHWHAYVSNEYRSTALDRLDSIIKQADWVSDPDSKKHILLKELQLLGSIPMSAYLNEEAEETAAEKILRLEEKMEELLSKSHR